MTLPNSVEPFRAALVALQRLLAQFNNRGVLIGGVAVGFLGRPRLTEDVDAMFLLATEALPHFLQAAAAEAIVPRIPEAEAFARANRVLLLRHVPSDTNIDISLGMLPFEEEMVDRAIVRVTPVLTVRLPTPEDLIIMKALAHRPKDLEDIRAVAERNIALDVARIEQWVKAFGEILEMPNLWRDLEKLLPPHSHE